MRRVSAEWPMAAVILIGAVAYFAAAAEAFEPLPRVEPVRLQYCHIRERRVKVIRDTPAGPPHKSTSVYVAPMHA